MPDDFNITPLFDSTSLSTSKARAPLPAPAGDALATALLTGMLSDITSLKEYRQDQLRLNDLGNSAIQAHQAVLTQLADQVNRLIAVARELDDRLHALDDKRTLEPDPPADPPEAA